MTFPPLAPRTLSRKIILVIVMTTLAATLTLIPAIFFTLRQGLHGQRQRHLTGVRQLVERLIEENRRAMKNYAVLFATDRQVKDNLYYYAELAGEREHPAAAVRHLVEAFGLPQIELSDRFGRVVVNAARPDRQDQDLSGAPLVSQALAGATGVGIEPYPDGFLLKAVAPIFHDEGQLIGTITTGLALNNEFALMIRELSGADIVIADRNGRTIAASRPDLARETWLAPGRPTLTLAGINYQRMTLPFVDAGGDPLGRIVILAEDRLPVILRRTTYTAVAILLAIALLSIIATGLVLRRVLAPVLALRDGAEMIGRGRFDHRVEVTSQDEIGGLAEVFNIMAENLQKMRAVEDKLKHAERLASIGEFTAATAHELNNPIANIVGLAKVARKDLPAGDLLAEDLDLIVREANRSGAIVRDLLLYSRASKPSREWLDCAALMDEAIAAVRPRHLNGRQIDLHFERTAADAEKIFADPAQLLQVFINLLTNAAQAVGEQGEIRITISAGTDGGLTITMADSGCGIADEHLDKVFYPFFTTKKSGEGTGLGLAVSYTIVQAHGGALTAANRPEGGALFVLTLPGRDSDD